MNADHEELETPVTGAAVVEYCQSSLDLGDALPRARKVANHSNESFVESSATSSPGAVICQEKD